MTNRKLLLACLLVLATAGATAATLARRAAGDSMTSAAQGFLDSLSAEQRATAVVAFDDKARLDWHFIPKDARKGLQIKLMNGEQREKAQALLQAGLSELGYGKAKTIISLEAILHQLEKDRPNAPIRDPERYFVTVFGAPGPKGTWGYSFEGHHLSLNFTVREGNVDAFTPFFFGANPAEVKTDGSVGPKTGTRVLHAEEDLAFKLLGGLTADQRKQAIVAAEAPKDLRGAGEPQPPADAPAGLPGAKLDARQTEAIWNLIKAYTDNMPAEIAAARLQEIEKAGIGKVHFAWAGAEKKGIGHYYRLQGPTFLVEFVNTQPDSLMNPANHIHAVWRQMGGDFGIERE